MPIQPAKSTLKSGALLAGKYRLLKMLGRGAAGVVWSAVNTTTSRKVALKLLLNPASKQRERLLREARAAGALSHPNVIDIYDVTQAEDGNPVLVLELLEGETLQHLIDERAPLPPLEAAGIGRDVARALAVAHASGIVHRDLKPSNIFMHQPGDDPPVVKVVDFGISKNLLAGDGTLTETGMAVGSPAFMSPEQVRGERTLDGRTDLWALGVILYEMLAGRRLFDGRTHEVLTQVLVEPIKPLEKLVPGIDPALVAVVVGLLERDVDKRTSSAEEVAERLGILTGVIREAPRKSIAAPPAPPGEAHDTTVVPRPMTEAKNAVPKAYVDEEEDDEPTHVAPFAMRAALAQRTVPSVYNDDEDEDDDQTKVAPDAILTAAIRASRTNEIPDSGVATVRPPPPDESMTDQNAVQTVRPPSMEVEAIIEPLRPPPVIAMPRVGQAAARRAPMVNIPRAPVLVPRAPTADTPPPDSVGTPPAAEVETAPPAAVGKARPAADKARPAAAKPAPLADKARPVAAKAAPPADKARPTAPKVAPPADKARPAAPKAAAPKATLPVDKAAPPVDKAAPTATEKEPPAAAAKAPPAAEKVRPVAAEKEPPVDAGHAAAAAEPAPVSGGDAAAEPPPADGGLLKLYSSRPPPLDMVPMMAGVLDTATAPSEPADAGRAMEPSAPEEEVSESAPEVSAPPRRNKVMVVVAVLFLLLALAIFLTQMPFR